jgi:polyhydroxyalkanoate synthesis regulator phasin
MKKILVIILSLTLVFTLSASAFAAPTVKNTVETMRTNPDLENPENERPENERPEGPRSIEALYTAYYPEGLATHTALVAEHEAFHTGRAALREAALAEREALKTEMRARFQSVHEDFDSGVITQEDARELITALREEIEIKKGEIEILRSQLETIIAEKQAANEQLATQREAIKAGIISALQSDPVDEGTVAAGLASSLDLLRQHIDLDYYYAAQIDALIGQ